MKNLLLLFGLNSLTIAAFAQQEKPELVTDRPDQTEASTLIPKGALQFETGFVFEKDNGGNSRTENFTWNTSLLKYGISNNLELRLISEYLEQRSRNEESTVDVKGLSPVAIGFKLKVAEANGVWPQTALIAHVNLKSGSKEFRPDYTAIDFRFTFAHDVGDKFSISYNVGAEWDGIQPEATFLYTFALGYTVTNRLAVFAETYSFFPEAHKADHRFDAGFTFAIAPLVQCDVSGGLGLSENAPDLFVGTGLSFRVFK